jgi:predicted nuclease with TOPRIM domain
MDNATIAAIVTCLITGLLSAGGWKFYEAVLRQRADQRKEEKNERLAYRDDLIKRVERLEDDKGTCMDALSDLKTEFATMKVKVQFIEKENEILKLKLQNRI